MNTLTAKINDKIKSNANGEITAEILNEILLDILAYASNKIGDLDYFNEPLQNAGDLVDALNTLQTEIESNKIGIHIGADNPNQKAPESYATLDYYLQTDQNGETISLWQYTEKEWCKIANYIDDTANANPFSTWSSFKITEQISKIQNNLQQQINDLYTLFDDLKNH